MTRTVGVAEHGKKSAIGLERLTAGTVFTISVAILAISPMLLSPFDLLNFTGFLIPIFMAWGLVLLWGFTGILSLGQSAFYGIGGYAYGVVGINFIESHGNTNLALALGLLVPAALACLLGLIMFFGRLEMVYVAILTLVMTMLIEVFLNQTAGDQWKIGNAYLGGNNGLGRFSATITDPPSLTISLGFVQQDFRSTDNSLFYLVLGLLTVSFLSLQAFGRSYTGRVLMATRDDSGRTETLGYDVRWIKTIVFAFGAMLAALSGILYTSWGNFIAPNVFGVLASILPVVWVAVAGRMSWTAVAIATASLSWLSQRLAIEGGYSYIVLGGLLIVVIVLMPDGIAPAVERVLRSGQGGRVGRVRSLRGSSKVDQGVGPSIPPE